MYETADTVDFLSERNLGFSWANKGVAIIIVGYEYSVSDYTYQM